MEIYNKVDKLVEFSVVTVGQTFMFDNEVYMAVRPFEVRPNFEYQAVCLNDGTLCRFKTDALVTPCKMFGTIEKKGEFR
jgi:hypothetical protein